MSAAVSAVQTMYTQATGQLHAMLKACHTEEEQDEVWTEYYALRKNFDDCVNQKFEEDDAELKQLETGANGSAQQIAKIGGQLNEIAEVLATLSDAVSWGLKIAAKVVA